MAVSGRKGGGPPVGDPEVGGAFCGAGPGTVPAGPAGGRIVKHAGPALRWLAWDAVGLPVVLTCCNTARPPARRPGLRLDSQHVGLVARHERHDVLQLRDVIDERTVEDRELLADARGVDGMISNTAVPPGVMLPPTTRMSVLPSLEGRTPVRPWVLGDWTTSAAMAGTAVAMTSATAIAGPSSRGDASACILGSCPPADRGTPRPFVPRPGVHSLGVDQPRRARNQALGRSMRRAWRMVRCGSHHRLARAAARCVRDP